MQKVQVKVSKKRNDRTSISNIFIDQFMKDANGDFVKVYLYLLRSTNADDPAVTVSEIADLLNLTEKDIVRALKYWNKVRAMEVTFDEAGTTPTSITFLNLEADAAEDPAAKKTEVVAEKAPAKKPSMARINELKKQEEFADVLFIVENYLGHPLNDTDVRTITYIYDELCFTVDLIEYLMEYCISNNHTSMRYIETVANSWSDQGIHSAASAKESAQSHSKNTLTVVKAFGINGRSVTSQEMEFIQRWYKEYHFSPEMVEEACNRTMLNLAKPSFTYAEKILKDWYQSGIQTLDAIREYDAAYKSSKTVAPTNTTAATATGNYRTAAKVNANNFNNFSQRTVYDFESMERSLVGKNSKN